MGGGQGTPAMPGQMGQGLGQMPTMNGAAPMQQPMGYGQMQQNAMGMAPQAMQQFQQMRMQQMPPNMASAGKGPGVMPPWMNPGGLRTGGLLG